VDGTGHAVVAVAGLVEEVVERVATVGKLHVGELHHDYQSLALTAVGSLAGSGLTAFGTQAVALGQAFAMDLHQRVAVDEDVAVLRQLQGASVRRLIVMYVLVAPQGGFHSGAILQGEHLLHARLGWYSHRRCHAQHEGRSRQ